MKKKILVLILTGIAALALTACGEPSSSSGGAAAGQKPASEATSEAASGSISESVSETASETTSEAASGAASEADSEAAAEATSKAALAAASDGGTAEGTGQNAAEAEKAAHVELDDRIEDNKEYAVITGYLEDGSALWTKETDRHEATELTSVGEIGIYNGLYYYYEGGSVVTLNLQDGDEVWRNADFGGASASWVFDTDGTLYISGWYGPMLVAIGVDGTTIQKLESAEGYMWPQDLEVQGDVIKINVTTEDSSMRETTIYIRKSDFSVQTE